MAPCWIAHLSNFIPFHVLSWKEKGAVLLPVLDGIIAVMEWGSGCLISIGVVVDPRLAPTVELRRRDMLHHWSGENSVLGVVGTVSPVHELAHGGVVLVV